MNQVACAKRAVFLETKKTEVNDLGGFSCKIKSATKFRGSNICQSERLDITVHSIVVVVVVGCCMWKKGLTATVDPFLPMPPVIITVSML